MIAFFFQVLICSAAITGLHVSFWDGMIFSPVRLRYLRTLPRWASKPVYHCLTCMASVWGSIYFFTYGDLSVWQWPLFILAVAGVNTAVYGLIGNADELNGEDYVRNQQGNA